MHQAWELPPWCLQLVQQAGGWVVLWQGLGCVARLCGMFAASCVLVRTLYCCGMPMPAWLQGTDARGHQPASWWYKVWSTIPQCQSMLCITGMPAEGCCTLVHFAWTTP